MSENEGGRKMTVSDPERCKSACTEGASAKQQRVTRYKEERRRQLATQFGRRDSDDFSSSSGTGGGLTFKNTKSSILRVAANEHTRHSAAKDRWLARANSQINENGFHKSSSSPVPDSVSSRSCASPASGDGSSIPRLRREKDKSAQRKSFLNRSHNEEEIPYDHDERKGRFGGQLQDGRGEPTMAACNQQQQQLVDPIPNSCAPFPSQARKTPPLDAKKASISDMAENILTLIRKQETKSVALPNKSQNRSSSPNIHQVPLRKTLEQGNSFLQNRRSPESASSFIPRKIASSPSLLPATLSAAAPEKHPRPAQKFSGRSSKAALIPNKSEFSSNHALSRTDSHRSITEVRYDSSSNSYVFCDENRNKQSSTSSRSPLSCQSKENSDYHLPESSLQNESEMCSPFSCLDENVPPVSSGWSIFDNQLEESKKISQRRTRTLFSDSSVLNHSSVNNRENNALSDSNCLTNVPISSSAYSSGKNSTFAHNLLNTQSNPSSFQSDFSENAQLFNSSFVKRSNKPNKLMQEIHFNSAPSSPVKHLSSILKKKSVDETAFSPAVSVGSSPVSILKRKTSQDENSASSSVTVTHASVPSSSSTPFECSARRQGILKKNCSFDESELLKRRSCSPDIITNSSFTEFKSILKNQRRSSLENLLVDSISPEPELHPILKKKSSRQESNENAESSEPHSILKRKTSVHNILPVYASSCDSNENNDSSISESVKPILKKKSSSEDNDSTSSTGLLSYEILKPILKKKSTIDYDFDDENKPVKPILKFHHKSPEFNGQIRQKRLSAEIDVKPILKQSKIGRVNDDDSSSDDGIAEEKNVATFLRSISKISLQKNDSKLPAQSRHSLDLSYIMSQNETDSATHNNSEPARPLSVSERISNLEHFLAQENLPSTASSPSSSQGAVSGKLNKTRKRFSTQPITFQELSSSYKSCDSPENPNTCYFKTSNNYESAENLQADLNNFGDNFSEVNSHYESVNSILSAAESQSNLNKDSGSDSGKVSSDEFDRKSVSRSNSVSSKKSFFDNIFSKVEQEIDELQTERKPHVAQRVHRRYAKSSEDRHITQPITIHELEKAKQLNCERSKYFSRTRNGSENTLVKPKPGSYAIL